MRKALSALLPLLLITVMAIEASAGIHIKLGVVTKPGSAQNIVADKFKELIESRSNGNVTVKIFHSKSIGNETEILQQIQMNTIQMGIITGGPFDTFDPIVRVINYPFLFKDHAQADAILDGALGAEILKSLERAGFKGLCFSENGFRNLTNNRRAVKRPEDVEGLKIRVMASAMHKTIWQQLGANPTPMPWPIYTELEQGVIDGQENPLWVMEVYKFYEIQDHMTLTRHVYSPHIDVASLLWWNTLDPATHELIRSTIYEAAVYQRKLNREKNSARLAFLKDQGMRVVETPEINAFRAKVAGIKDTDIYQDPRVRDLLIRVLEATQ
ncbi:TRAP-type C4-dicarboxylate transport system, periplasmic component [Olavius algarvensis associated proteobacterium Delta 3]|nr:TRAP-type C4-dicarboxylate transport system, periplasmic component [Olavius algarvensis associated proteobacterium Delta 3]CAB5159103.1 TRAP-type C4-dicarboxylate transport system, periplasmic component [Olavius algarvensis associated proteobacterium Delta 3]